MSYFKTRSAQAIPRPKVNKVLLIQCSILMVAGVVCSMFSPLQGLSVLLGGGIALLGQVFYNHRALRNFGSTETTSVVMSTFTAMWGRWLIVITASLIAFKIEQIQAGALLISMFVVHMSGALLLPIFVKRIA